MVLKRILKIVCKDTPVLVDRNAISKSGRVYALAAGLPFMAMPIQEVPLLSWSVANETVNEQNNLIAPTDEDLYIGLLDGDPYTSPQQKQRDKYELNDADWYSVSFEQVDGTSKRHFALTDDWIKKQGYETEKVVNLNLPEQGISGPFRITYIKHIIPQKKPEGDAGDGYDWKPVTGLFEHQSDQVYNISFDNGEELGVTYQHPIYSSTAGDWKLAGELEIGEQVLTKDGEATVTSSAKKEGQETVYNLEVQELHNFLVGESEVVVHNSCARLILGQVEYDEWVKAAKALGYSDKAAKEIVEKYVQGALKDEVLESGVKVSKGLAATIRTAAREFGEEILFEILAEAISIGFTIDPAKSAGEVTFDVETSDGYYTHIPDQVVLDGNDLHTIEAKYSTKLKEWEQIT